MTGSFSLAGNVSDVALVARLESISSIGKVHPRDCLENALVSPSWEHLVSPSVSLILNELMSNAVYRRISVGTKRGIFW